MVYVVGATTVWLRYRLVGLPADIAVQHQSRSTVIALGLRGIVSVAIALACLAAASYGAAWLYWRCWPHRKLDKAARNLEFRKRLLDVAHHRLARWRPGRIRIMMLAGLVLIVLAAFVSWRVFGAATCIVIAVGAALRALRLRGGRQPVVLSTILIVAFAAVVGGLAWQITPDIPVQVVRVEPQLPNINEAVPYFGETDKHVYVGVLVPDRKGGWIYCHQIRELGRDKVLLTFIGKKYSFSRTDRAPAKILLGLLGHGSAIPSQNSCHEWN
jgi:hypothetical protein